MRLEEAAQYWKDRLSEGKPINRVRVKRLLELAGAQRRGLVIVEKIRRILDERGLETEPDFEAAWIEAQLRVRLKETNLQLVDAIRSDLAVVCDEYHTQPAEGIDDSMDPGTEEPLPAGSDATPVAEPLNSPPGSPGVVEASVSPRVDALARFSSIPAANRGVVSVLLNDPMTTATTKMMLEGYSQLAIMQGQGAHQVRGMISWESIARRTLLGPPPTIVSDCREDAQVIDAERPLHDGILTIEKYGYVLVRSKEQKITGIVTATDLLAEFGRISYAFMSIRAIELLLRNKLHGHLQDGDFSLLETHSRARTEYNWEFLTFGESVRLLERPEIWVRLKVQVDKVLFSGRLEEIRTIRNDVMHFSPDPLDSTQRRSLEQMEQFLSQIFA